MEKILYFPLKPYGVNQKFGNVTSLYTSQGLKGHNGIDFLAKHGQSIYASHDGVCIPTVDDHGGNTIVLVSNDGKFKTIYGHLMGDSAVVENGQKVKAGDLIGYADSTGISTGDHCHMGLCFFPQQFDDGYNGYVDPEPYFNGKYAQDISNPIPKFQFTKTLKMGSWNADVRELQSLYKRLNLYSGAIDGIYGKMTLGATTAFQKASNLQVDGIAGSNTIKLLNKLL